MNEEKITTEFIQTPTGFTIAESDLTTGKVIINNIEITSVEDWEKVIHSTVELQQENARLKDKINMAIKYYELNQHECVIGRNKDEKLIKEYYLPAQCSKKLLDILKEN